MEKPALTIKETAKEFQFPEYAIRTLVKRGAFPVMFRRSLHCCT